MPGFEGTTVQSVPHFCTVVQEAWPAAERPGVHIHFCICRHSLCAHRQQPSLRWKWNYMCQQMLEKGEKKVLNWIV